MSSILLKFFFWEGKQLTGTLCKILTEFNFQQITVLCSTLNSGFPDNLDGRVHLHISRLSLKDCLLRTGRLWTSMPWSFLLQTLLVLTCVRLFLSVSSQGRSKREVKIVFLQCFSLNPHFMKPPSIFWVPFWVILKHTRKIAPDHTARHGPKPYHSLTKQVFFSIMEFVLAKYVFD